MFGKPYISQLFGYPGPERSEYLVVDHGTRQRLRDEAYSADLWWDMQLSYNSWHAPRRFSAHAVAGSDEGRVTSHTLANMYPILLRATSAPSFSPQPFGTAQETAGAGSPGLWFRFETTAIPRQGRLWRRSISLSASGIFTTALSDASSSSLGQRSKNGENVTCGDCVPRVLHPCLPIASLDGKEADIYTTTRAALAHFPCGRCLVRSDQLCQISGHIYEARTTDSMKRVYLEAMSKLRNKDTEELLQKYGLHAIENALWEIRNSSPYEAASYDLLHSDDLGKFGKRIWVWVREVLDGLGTTGLLTKNMAIVPRWPGLKHFLNVTTKQMNDGQEFLDIEKDRPLAPAASINNNSSFCITWIHLIRAHMQFRMIMGLHCITDDQIARKEKYAVEYEKWCTGAPTVYCTRVNEGSHSENRDSAQHVNHHNNDKQVSAIDAAKEAMARIRMTVDAYDNEQQQEAKELAEHVGISPESMRATAEDLPTSDDHWRCLDDDTRWDFDKKLRAFLRDEFPDEDFRADGEKQIQMRHCNCIYVHYTSAEDYTDKFDILRCNPSFQSNNEQRLDCVNVNLTPDALDFEFARLLYLFRCRLPSKCEVDVALVRVFKQARWKPKTVWENCRVLEDGRTMLMLPKYIFFIRGAHLINAFGSKKEDTTFYLNDVVDADWFLRAGN
ncbi:hypothetical protein GGX14DRAFT_570267 [Mycena pura]|uniref:Uncharacterized protein n=1 Tax=Mycena pura TaxID=153505 RepID=A0AAD6Y741_9AGAR|nr:hypothetical protein GGX14DRAFT_570267 [Mycena pura]